MRLFVRTLAAAAVALAFGAGLFLALPASASATAVDPTYEAAKAHPVVLLAAAPAAPAKARAKKAPATYTGAVNVNTASATQLTDLPGIGPSKAQRIVEARKVKAFKRPEDLVRVKGIGPKTVKKLLPYLKVTGPTNFHRQ